VIIVQDWRRRVRCGLLRVARALSDGSSVENVNVVGPMNDNDCRSRWTNE